MAVKCNIALSRVKTMKVIVLIYSRSKNLIFQHSLEVCEIKIFL